MPRERFDDPTTPGRYAQVNWRRHGDSDPDAPGYVQVSTHDQTEDHPAGELIGWAIGIISNVDAPTPGWALQTAEWREAARAWLDKAATHSAELDSNYAQLDEKQTAAMIKALHKARRQAFGHPEVNITVNVGPSRGLPTAAVAALRSVVRRDPRSGR